jgi:hypothetical protein
LAGRTLTRRSEMRRKIVRDIQQRDASASLFLSSSQLLPGITRTIVREYPVTSGFGVGVSGFGLLNRGRAAASAAALPGITSTIVLLYPRSAGAAAGIFTRIFYKKVYNCTCFLYKNAYINMYQQALMLTKLKRD